MPYVINPWPDLPSYSSDVWEEELNALNIEELRPLVMVSNHYNNFLTNEMDNVPEGYRRKLELLEGFILEHEYELVYQDEKLVIYQ